MLKMYRSGSPLLLLLVCSGLFFNGATTRADLLGGDEKWGVQEAQQQRLLASLEAYNKRAIRKISTISADNGEKTRDDNTDPFEYLDAVASVTTLKPNNNNNGSSSNSRPSTRSTTTSTIATFGYSNFSPDRIPMSPDAHFPIASNTKLYTAVAIYQLHERGKLDVTANIATMLDENDFVKFGLPRTTWWSSRTYCPRVASAWSRVWPWSHCETMTLRHLLSMSSGIYPPLNCDAEPTSPGACDPDPYFVSRGSIAETVGTFLLQPLMFKPGTDYHYSNPNFILAAYFVEKYSGMTFRDYLRANIFGPLGLSNTYFDFYNQALGLDPERVGQYVRYHDAETGELLSVGADVLQLDLGVASGTGGVISTVRDHVKFWYALFNKTTLGAPLFTSPASQKAILTPFTLMEAMVPLVFPNGTQIEVWGYYTQGTVMICAQENCPDGPLWIMYEGGAITVHTANLLDYSTMKMVQVWTSTLVAMTDRDAFRAAVDQQTGFPMQVINDWLDPELNNPMIFCWEKMLSSDNEHKTTTTPSAEGSSKAAGFIAGE